MPLPNVSPSDLLAPPVRRLADPRSLARPPNMVAIVGFGNGSCTSVRVYRPVIPMPDEMVMVRRSNLDPNVWYCVAANMNSDIFELAVPGSASGGEALCRATFQRRRGDPLDSARRRHLGHGVRLTLPTCR